MKGTAIIAAFILIIFGSLVIGGYLFLISSQTYMTKKMNDSIRAFYVAEAGLERAASDLKVDTNWFDGDINGYTADNIQTNSYVPIEYNGVNPVSFGQGTYFVEIMKVTNKRVRLKSTGTVFGEIRTVIEDVYIPSIFDWGVFGNESISLKNNALIDSYNSENGPYGPDNSGENGDTGTNSTDDGAIELKNDAVIEGDVAVGPGSNPETVIDNDGTITGEQSALENAVTMPPPPAVPPLEPRGSLTVEESAAISSSGRYDSITLNNGAVLTIDADIVIFVGSILLNNDSMISVTGNGKLVLYVDSSIEIKNGVRINDPSKDPSDFILYGTDNLTAIEFKNEDPADGIYGCIYARNADIIIKNSVQIYGSVVGNSVDMRNGSCVHYDEAQKGTGPPTGAAIEVDWHEE